MRLENWPERLSKYLDSVVDTPFELGKFDCAIFADGAVEAVTGRSPFKERSLFGLKERLQFLENCGGLAAAVESMIEDVGGVGESPAYAQRGDILLMTSISDDVFGGLALGVMGLTGLPLVPGPGGVFSESRDRIVSAWRI